MKANCLRRRHSQRTVAQHITYSDFFLLAQWQRRSSRDFCPVAKPAFPATRLVVRPDAEDGDDRRAAHSFRDNLFRCPALANPRAGVTSSPSRPLGYGRSNCSTGVVFEGCTEAILYAHGFATADIV